MRVLAIADEPFPGMPDLLASRPDLIVSCGDLPWDDLERIVDVANVPLLFVPGNHDPALVRPREGGFTAAIANPHLEEPPGPRGCTSVDGRIEDVRGLRVAGLGGSVRYREGPNQYTQAEMARRARRLADRALVRRLRDGRRVDVLITHSPPRGLGDEEDDHVHHGFEAFHPLLRRLRPRYLLHGHVHPYGIERPDRVMGGTRVVNVIPFKILDIPVEERAAG
jgi:Icc-related predicted phosphoesterase